MMTTTRPLHARPDATPPGRRFYFSRKGPWHLGLSRRFVINLHRCNIVADEMHECYPVREHHVTRLKKRLLSSSPRIAPALPESSSRQSIISGHVAAKQTSFNPFSPATNAHTSRIPHCRRFPHPITPKEVHVKLPTFTLLYA